MPHAKHDSILDIVLARPWWVSLAIAAGAYIVWRFVPPLIPGHPHLTDLVAGLMRIAPPVSIMFAAVVPVALLSKLRRHQLLKNCDESDEAESDLTEFHSHRP